MTKGNFDELSLLSGDNIPEALLEYICYEHQYNIFGYGLLDPMEFASKFHFSSSYLLGRHPAPYQSQLRNMVSSSQQRQNHRLRLCTGRKEQNEIVCGTRLENALFILANYALNITATSVLEDHTLVRQYGFLRVLESFALIQDGRTGKITYAYKLDDTFRRNLSSLYLTTSRASLVRLRKSGLGPLYVFILKLRDAVFSEGRVDTAVGNTPAFDYLCNLAGVPSYDEPKYRKRDLNIALGKIQRDTEISFTVEWVRAGAAERYTPLFHFIPSPGQPVGLPSDSYVKVCRDCERTEVAITEFKHNLVDACPFEGNRYSNDAERFFFDWIRRPNRQQAMLVCFAMEKTFINLGCRIPLDLEERVNLFQFYAERKDPEEFSSWLKEIFNGQHGFSSLVFRCRDDKK